MLVREHRQLLLVLAEHAADPPGTAHGIRNQNSVSRRWSVRGTFHGHSLDNVDNDCDSGRVVRHMVV